MELLIFIAIGGIAGWLAGEIRRGHGFGLMGNIIVGILGAFTGSFLFNLLGISTTGLIGSLITAVVGAIVLLTLISFIRQA